jgi:hypothetical protein
VKKIVAAASDRGNTVPQAGAGSLHLCIEALLQGRWVTSLEVVVHVGCVVVAAVSNMIATGESWEVVVVMCGDWGRSQ